MLKQVHDHIVSELGQSSRTDTIFVVTSVIFNLIVLGINSAVASNGDGPRYERPSSNDLVLVVFIGLTILVNAIASVALYVGRRTRRRLLEGLVAMYRDNEVDKYYSPALLSDYGTRYLLFTGIIALLALTAIVVPLILRLA